MAKTIDNGKSSNEDKTELLGQKPYSEIGSSIVKKLKKRKSNKVGHSTSFSGEKANVGGIPHSLSKFVKK
jgi:hypothetical protein